MKLAKGPRPWTIWVFSGALIAAALHAYITSMALLGPMQQVFELQFPWDGWNRDWTIVALSARFSIVLIPILLIAAFAAGIARWLITAFGAFQLLNLPRMVETWASNDGINAMYLFQPVMTLVALICLWLPSSSRYFAQKEAVDVCTFE